MFDSRLSEFDRRRRQGKIQRPVKSAILPFNEKHYRLRSVLVDVAGTQSRPKLNSLEKLWTSLSSLVGSKHTLDDFNSLLEELVGSRTKLDKELRLKGFEYKNLRSLEKLYFLLKFQSGWGDKTAALFVKYVVLCHLKSTDESEQYIKDFSYSPSMKEDFSFFEGEINFDDDKFFFVPVDSVIEFIFIELNKLSKGREITINFRRINDVIRHYCHDHKLNSIQSLYWDDLWYWGFITQNSESDRVFNLNYSKFISWKASTQKEWNEVIREKAEEFISLITKQ